MDKSFTPKNRRKLQKIMVEAFANEIHTLSPELQSVLADDMVTALQNRLTVFQRIQAKTTPYQK